MSLKRLIQFTSAGVCSTLLATFLLQQGAYAQTASPGPLSPDHFRLSGNSSFSSASLTSKSASREPAFISPRIQTHSSAMTRVIVQLSSQPAAAGLFAARSGVSSLAAESSESALRAEQDGFVSAAISKGISLKVNYRFNTVLNGMEVSVPANQIPQLAKLPGVLSVYENRVYTSIPVMEPSAEEEAKPFDTHPLEQIGVDAAWAKGLTGKGLKVGVVDTGVDYLHPDLAGAYQGGYDSSNGDADPYEDYDPGHQFFTEHGTHVSGTIVGRAANTTSGIVQKGIAYESDLYVYKVLSGDETGRATGTTATVIDGIERAVKDGMDVINLSLGSDGDKDPNSPDAIAVNNAVLAGIVVVAANGNAGDLPPYYYTMGTPATSQLGISVGAATSPGSRFEADAVSSFGDTSYELHAMSWRTGDEDFAATLGTGPTDAVYVGLGDDADYTAAGDVTGKIVLISRGSLTFVDKIAKAKSHGAKAVIIFNGLNNGAAADLSETIAGRDGFIGELGFIGDSYDYIPTYDMSGAEGRALAREIIADGGVTPLTFTLSSFESSIAPGDRLTAFSSRGPNSDGDYGIKPDFAAPGNSIMSTWPKFGKYDTTATYEEAYNRISGTSMAAPHVAGLSLLLLQEHPEWTPFDVRAALANTADTLYDTDGSQYDVYSQGAGRVNIEHAINTPALLQTIDELMIYDKNLQPVTVTNYGDSASFGLMHAGETAAAEQLQLKNTSDAAVTYHASIVMHDGVDSFLLDFPDPSAISVQLDGLAEDGTVSAAAGAATPFSFSVAPSLDAAEGVYEGEVLLQSDGLPSLHLPFSVHVGEQTPDSGLGVQDVTLSNRIISPSFEDVDGVQDSMSIAFELKAEDAFGIDVKVYDLEDRLIGYLMSYTNWDEDGNLVAIEPGEQSITDLSTVYAVADEDGYMKFDENDEPVLGELADGTYRLEVSAPVLDPDDPTKPLFDEEGHLLSYYALSTFNVQTDAHAGPVKAARGAFKANVSNTTTLGQPVLTLPVTEGITYQVTHSSATSLIDDAGVLKARPSSNTTVDVTVTIASADAPAVKSDVVVPVTLSGTGSGSVYVPFVPPVTGVSNDSPAISQLLEQGQHASFIAAKAVQDGTTVNVSITDDELAKALKEASPAPAAVVIKAEVDAKQQASLELTSAQLKQLAGAAEGSTVVLTTGQSSLALPVSLFKGLPADSSVHVVIRPDSAAADAFKTEFSGAIITGTPVAFDVEVITDKGAAPLKVPVTASIKRSFTVTGGGEGIDRLGAVFEEDGSYFPAPASFSENTDGTYTVVVSRPGLSTYAAAYRKTAFTDIKFSWAKTSIEALANTFLLNGTSATTFSPGKQVTRAEFAVMLARALGLQSSEAAKTAFADVSGDAWYASGIGAAADAGLIQGTGQGLFKPKAFISEKEMDIILARALKLLGITDQALPPHTAHDDSDTAGSSKTAVTREAAASAIYNLLHDAKLIN